MPDTQRTKTALLALLADNVTGAISEQDMRDILVSNMGAYGGLRTDTAGNTDTVPATIGHVDFWGDPAGHYSDDDDSFSVDATNSRFTAAFAMRAEVHVTGSFALATTGNVFTFRVYRNGVDSGIACGDVADSSGFFNVNMSGILDCAASDVIEVRALAVTGESVTANYGNFWIKRID